MKSTAKTRQRSLVPTAPRKETLPTTARGPRSRTRRKNSSTQGKLIQLQLTSRRPNLKQRYLSTGQREQQELTLPLASPEPFRSFPPNESLPDYQWKYPRTITDKSIPEAAY